MYVFCYFGGLCLQVAILSHPGSVQLCCLSFMIKINLCWSKSWSYITTLISGFIHFSKQLQHLQGEIMKCTVLADNYNHVNMMSVDSHLKKVAWYCLRISLHFPPWCPEIGSIRALHTSLSSQRFQLFLNIIMSISAHACWAVKRTGERERDCVFECVQKVCVCVSVAGEKASHREFAYTVHARFIAAS